MLNIYTAQQLAEKLQLDVRKVREYATKGLISGSKVGQEWRFTDENIIEFLTRRAYIPPTNQDNKVNNMLSISVSDSYGINLEASFSECEDYASIRYAANAQRMLVSHRVAGLIETYRGRTLVSQVEVGADGSVKQLHLKKSA